MLTGQRCASKTVFVCDDTRLLLGVPGMHIVGESGGGKVVVEVVEVVEKPQKRGENSPKSGGKTPQKGRKTSPKKTPEVVKKPPKRGEPPPRKT